MKTLVKSLALCCFFLISNNAFADGFLTLTAQLGSNIQVLSIQEMNNSFTGTLTTNGSPEPVYAYYTDSTLNIQIGAASYSLAYVRSTNQVSFTGTLSGGRTALFFATYKPNRSTWLYDGTVGQYDDLTGKGRTDSLDISYGKYKLSLDSTGSGNCSGVIRIGGTTTTVFSCETSGSLQDAFFTNPDQVLMWLANLYFQ
jgi:hypothetical protein